jgi:hypothetical protein
MERAVRSMVALSRAPEREKRNSSTAPSPKWPMIAEPAAATTMSRLMSSCRAIRFRIRSRVGPKPPSR